MLTPAYIIGQIIGVIAVAGTFVSYQTKTQKQLLIVNMIATALFCVHYMLLGASSGMVLNLFDASPYMLEIGIPALRLLGIAWLISVPGAVLSSALQGLSMGTQSLILNTTRQTVLPLVFALLFAQLGRLHWIWIALILVELLCLPLALFIWRRAHSALADFAE